MKKIIYTIVAVAALCAVSCNKDAYVPGVADKEGCYDVEFLGDSEQPLAGKCELTPDEKTFTFKLSRAITEGAIEVPLEAVCAKHPGALRVDNAYFEDGAATSEVNVHFADSIENGVEYVCDVQVKGDEYALKYGFSKTVHSFTAVFTSWTELCTGSFTSAMFGSNNGARLLKNNDNDKRYRIENAHSYFPNIDFYLKSELCEDKDGNSYYVITVPKFGTKVSYGSHGRIFYSDNDVFAGSNYEESVYYPEYGQVFIDAVYAVSAGDIKNDLDYFLAE